MGNLTRLLTAAGVPPRTELLHPKEKLLAAAQSYNHSSQQKISSAPIRVSMEVALEFVRENI